MAFTNTTINKHQIEEPSIIDNPWNQDQNGFEHRSLGHPIYALL